ncbi:uncharacterized protein LOC115555893 [Gadus morhua]|uniref:uncharacterized protein LOC115555893 n=1 Tax=Gadus morhua TaxID=8049 RepID=UPI0011B6154D|nr:uncharacterized protein LOC115555893 [Gadus morhua]
MAGRMIDHSFLHGGYGVSGISLPVLKNTELTAAETTRVTDLCLSWDLPVPTSTNHDWLFQELLSHAVIHRVRLPIKQIRKGLKGTGIWPPLSSRPDVGPIIFPRESNEELNPQAVIQNIHWPQPKCDSDEDEDDPVPLEKVSLITGFLWKFIEEASPEVLRDLMRFWVGWELPAKELFVEVATSTYPTAFTCFYKLKLPGHYQTYPIFHQENDDGPQFRQFRIWSCVVLKQVELKILLSLLS